MSGGSGEGTPVSDVSVEKWVGAYWSGLITQLDALDAAMYDELLSDATTFLTNYDTTFLSTYQLDRAKALYICVEAAGMPGLGGWSQERHYTKLKMFDRQWQKDTTNYDWAIGELCRVLRISPKELNAKTASTRAANYNKYRKNTIYVSQPLDQRGQIFRDYDLEDVVTDRKDNRLDNRYKPA